MDKEPKIIYNLVLIGVVVLAITYLLLRYAITSSLNEYPHDVRVWGNVSDWGIFIVTTITAYYIYQTFAEQKRLNDVQRRVLFEQKEVTRIDHLPEIVIDNKYQADHSQLVRLRLRKNTAVNIAVFRIYGGFFTEGNQDPFIKQIWSEGETIGINHINLNPPNPTSMHFSFRDLLGNLYVQVLHLYPNGQMSLSQPLLTTEERLNSGNY